MKISLNFGLVCGVVYAQSTEQARPDLNGICLERGRDGFAVLVATDGHRLIAARDTSCTLPEGFESVTLDFGFKPGMRAHRYALNKTRVEFDLPAPDYSSVWEATAFLANETREHYKIGRVKRIDREFPPWRQVVPNGATKHTGSPTSCFNLKYIADMGEAAARIRAALGVSHGGRGNESLSWRQEADNTPVRFHFGVSDAFGVIMPCRTYTRNTNVPDWL